jgi:hypothetical protein
LVAVGRKDEARAILAKYHGNGDPDAPLVLLEWKEVEEAVKLDASDKRWSVIFLEMKRKLSINFILGGIIQSFSTPVTPGTGHL